MQPLAVQELVEMEPTPCNVDRSGSAAVARMCIALEWRCDFERARGPERPVAVPALPGDDSREFEE